MKKILILSLMVFSTTTVFAQCDACEPAGACYNAIICFFTGGPKKVPASEHLSSWVDFGLLLIAAGLGYKLATHSKKKIILLVGMIALYLALHLAFYLFADKKENFVTRIEGYLQADLGQKCAIMLKWSYPDKDITSVNHTIVLESGADAVFISQINVGQPVLFIGGPCSGLNLMIAFTFGFLLITLLLPYKANINVILFLCLGLISIHCVNTLRIYLDAYFLVKNGVIFMRHKQFFELIIFIWVAQLFCFYALKNEIFTKTTNKQFFSLLN